MNKLKNWSEYPSGHFSGYPTGLVLQHENSGWHGIYVIIKSNERFVWVRSWDERDNDDIKPTRYLKTKLPEYGYSLKGHGWDCQSEGDEYVGRVIDLFPSNLNKVKVKIHEVSKNDIVESGDKLAFEYYGKCYYMAFETNPLKQVSVTWVDLKWLRKFYGTKHLDETGNITKKSLNEGRLHNINKMKKAIKLNTHVRDLEMLNENGTFKMVKNHNFMKPFPDQYRKIDLRGKIQYKPTTLTEDAKEMYIKDINRGLYIICKYV